MDLHGKIMNIPAKVPHGYSAACKQAYKIGHRDARHAAAEIVVATEIDELQEQIKILREALEYYEMWDRSEDEGTTARVALAATEPKE